MLGARVPTEAFIFLTYSVCRKGTRSKKNMTYSVRHTGSEGVKIKNVVLVLGVEKNCCPHLEFPWYAKIPTPYVSEKYSFQFVILEPLEAVFTFSMCSLFSGTKRLPVLPI